MNGRTLFGGALVACAVALLSPLAGCGSGGGGTETDGGHGDGNAGADSSVHHEGGGTSHDGASDAMHSSDGADGGKAGGHHDGGEDAAGDQSAGDSGDSGAAVSFSIDMSRGPASQFQPPTQPAPVSPYIYGINASGSAGATGDFTHAKTHWGLVRMGGNAFTDWNWTTNYLNLGNTDCFWQGAAPGGANTLAGAISQSVDSVPAAQTEGAAYVATVPVLDYVSAAIANDATCPALASTCVDGGGTASTTGANSNNLDFASIDPASTAFVSNVAHKPGAFCTCPPGPACDAGCSVSTNPVYQDEFVNFVSSTYATGGAPVFFDLDNEPNYWGSTHPEVWPITGVVPCETAATVTYDDILNRDVTTASAVKAAWPAAKVFGPVVAQDGIVYAHSYVTELTDPHAPTEFLDYYLAQLAGKTDAGTSLLDVLDVHYYNEQNSSPSQCMQNPRMFWDPDYTEITATATDNIDFGWSGFNDYFDINWYPRKVIPRLLGKIATAYTSSTFTSPQLSFSEYNSGCNANISGAIAEADDLGIFGREGVFAAALQFGTAPATNYALAAVDLYRNYDGNGAVVGDTAVRAATTNVGLSSVYAFAHSTLATAVDVVAINKSTSAVVASISIANAPALTSVAAYDLVDGSPSVVAVGGTAPTVICTAGSCALTYTMPPTSATTLILR